MMNHKHMWPLGLLILLVGIGFLLADLGVWAFWGMKWWTAVFLIVGIAKLCHGCCKGKKK